MAHFFEVTSVAVQRRRRQQRVPRQHSRSCKAGLKLAQPNSLCGLLTLLLLLLPVALVRSDLMAPDAATTTPAATLARAHALRLSPEGPTTDDLAQAVHLFQHVAQQNVSESRDAHFALGEMYELGEAVAPSSWFAEHHYVQAAMFGSHEAMFKLALLDPLQTMNAHRDVLSEESSFTEVASRSKPSRSIAAVDYQKVLRRHAVQQLSQYQTAALAENPDAAIALAYRYKLGVDVVGNCSLSATYYEFAVNTGMAKLLTPGANGIDSEFPRHNVKLLTKAKSFSAAHSQRTSLLQEYYQYSAVGGDPDSEFRLGKLLYVAGIEAMAASSTRSENPAFIAAGVDVEAESTMGTAESNLNQAFELFTSAAAGGSAEAYAGLGHMFYEGTPSLARNVTAALENFKISTKLGNAGGHNGVGMVFYEGIDPNVAPKNLTKALLNFAKAASQGHLPGIYNTAVMLLQGPPVPIRESTSSDDEVPLVGRDFKKALHYFTVAAAQGHVDSIVALAHMHLHGIGTTPNCDLATDHFKLAAEAMFVDPKVGAGLEHVQNSNYRRAILTLNEAAEQGSSTAQMHAAALYKHNCRSIMESLEVDSGSAHRIEFPLIDWISGFSFLKEDFDTDPIQMAEEVAARWVDIVANVVNSVLQRQEIDTSATSEVLRLHPFCRSRAIELLERAGEQDQLATGVELGDLYYDAGSGGGIGGHYSLDVGLEENGGRAASLQMAAHYYRKSISEGRNARAMFNIAFMHQFGIGLRKDFHLAERYYDMASATDYRAFAPCQLALLGLQLHRIYDGEALPDYLMVIDFESVLVYVLTALTFIVGSYWLLVNNR